MSAIRDPEHIERRTLVAACPMTCRRVLEIGCGSGKLTRQYGRLPGKLVALDLNFGEVREADRTPARSAQKVAYLCASGEVLPFQDQAFDIALFASSL